MRGSCTSPNRPEDSARQWVPTLPLVAVQLRLPNESMIWVATFERGRSSSAHGQMVGATSGDSARFDSASTGCPQPRSGGREQSGRLDKRSLP
jgi:hypothetical protein